jgi:uncharacterized membrane protein SpoIIM required for sporulation
MIILVVISVFMALVVSLYVMLSISGKKENIVSERLARLTKESEIMSESELEQPLFVRFISLC